MWQQPPRATRSQDVEDGVEQVTLLTNRRSLSSRGLFGLLLTGLFQVRVPVGEGGPPAACSFSVQMVSVVLVLIGTEEAFFAEEQDSIDFCQAWRQTSLVSIASFVRPASRYSFTWRTPIPGVLWFPTGKTRKKHGWYGNGKARILTSKSRRGPSAERKEHADACANGTGEAGREMKRHTCPVCGFRTLPNRYDWDVCPVCFWEDDVLETQGDQDSSANHMPLSEAQANFILMGAAKPSVKKHVRSPRPLETRDPTWRPLTRTLRIVASGRMTLEEWERSRDLEAMLIRLRVSGKDSERKLRLWSCQCVRRVWQLLTLEPYRQAVSMTEAFADDLVGREEWHLAAEAARALDDNADAADGTDAEVDAAAAVLNVVKTSVLPSAHSAAINASLALAEAESDSIEQPILDAKREVETALQASLLRDIFGLLPFRSVVVEPAWLTPRVLSLAEAAYQERSLPSGHLDNGRLAVLADALDEQGCRDADILGHLRSGEAHVRGCWAVDLLLGKS